MSEGEKEDASFRSCSVGTKPCLSLSLHADVEIDTRSKSPRRAKEPEETRAEKKKKKSERETMLFSLFDDDAGGAMESEEIYGGRERKRKRKKLPSFFLSPLCGARAVAPHTHTPSFYTHKHTPS